MLYVVDKGAAALAINHRRVAAPNIELYVVETLLNVIKIKLSDTLYIVTFVIEIIIVSMRVDFMRRNQIETCNERCRVRLTCLVGMQDKYVW